MSRRRNLENGLGKAMRSSGALKGFKVKVDNKMKEGFGETNYDKKLIRINKKRHNSPNVGRITPNKDGSEKLGVTILHELEHVRRPDAGERSVERVARRKFGKMNPRQRSRLYGLLKK